MILQVDHTHICWITAARSLRSDLATIERRLFLSATTSAIFLYLYSLRWITYDIGKKL